VTFLRSCRLTLVIAPLFLATAALAQAPQQQQQQQAPQGPQTPMEAGLKALQDRNLEGVEKALGGLAKERDPRAQFLLGFYVYGNPDSKLADMNKAVPMLLDASERGYVPAMIPLAAAYADGKGVPKSFYDAYKWLAIAELWQAPRVQLFDAIEHELKPEEIAKAKAEAAAYTFKTK